MHLVVKSALQNNVQVYFTFIYLNETNYYLLA